MISKRNIIGQLYLILMLITFFSISTLSQTVLIINSGRPDFGDGPESRKVDFLSTDISNAEFRFNNSGLFRGTLFISLSLTDSLNYKTNSAPNNFQRENVSWSYKDHFKTKSNFTPHSVGAINDVWSYKRIYLWIDRQTPRTSENPPGIYEGTAILTVAY